PSADSPPRPRVMTRGCSSKSSGSGTSPAPRAAKSSRCAVSPSSYSTSPRRRTCSSRMPCSLTARDLLRVRARHRGRGEQLVALLAQVPGQIRVHVVEQLLARRVGLLLRLGDRG